MTLAEQQQTKNCLIQRYRITHDISPSRHSNHSVFHYVYYGYIYPENISFFKENGFDITTIFGERANAECGKPYINLFKINEKDCINSDKQTIGKEIYDEIKRAQIPTLSCLINTKKFNGDPIIYFNGQVLKSTIDFLHEQGFEIYPLETTLSEDILNGFIEKHYIVPKTDLNHMSNNQIAEACKDIPTGYLDILLKPRGDIDY